MDTEQLKLSSTILFANSSNNNYVHIFMTMILSSLLTSFINYICNNFNFNFIKKKLFSIFKISKKEYKIILSSRIITNKFGHRHNDISEQKIAVLYYIKKNISNYSDLFELKQDYTKKNIDYGLFDTNIKESYYDIYKEQKFIVKKEQQNYIKIQTNDEFIFKNNEKNNTDIILNNLILISNKDLLYIQNFIQQCVDFKKNDEITDTNQYIYTYIGQDEQNKLNYNSEIFIPYTTFDNLVGKHIQIIEKNIDFFMSKEGEEWYKHKGIPYQLTHLYYGEPGTGKSIIASAIATKYNLDIIKIKFSNIKNNTEFSKVLKNREILGKKINYDKILYLFDEVDTDLNSLIHRNNIISELKNNNCDIKENLMLKKYDLNIGHILEEINGINQMYGRKIIFITNNYQILENIHNGAFIRPGRIDLKLEIKKLNKLDILKIINCYFPEQNINNFIHFFEDYKYTAAEIVNICKTSLNFNQFINIINNK